MMRNVPDSFSQSVRIGWRRKFEIREPRDKEIAGKTKCYRGNNPSRFLRDGLISIKKMKTSNDMQHASDFFQINYFI